MLEVRAFKDVTMVKGEIAPTLCLQESKGYGEVEVVGLLVGNGIPDNKGMRGDDREVGLR